MITKHTPGPWTTNEADHDAPYQDIKIKAGKHHTVCTVWIDDAPVHDFNALQEANARLIASAPDLLEALKQIEPILTRMYGPQAAELPPMQIVHAAIAKAEAA